MRASLLGIVTLGWAAVAGAQVHDGTPGLIEGRPGANAVSPVQRLVDAAGPGARIEVRPGTYEGDLIIDRPLHLIGRGRPRLVGSGTGSVVRVRAAGVVVEGFDIDGRRGGDLARDTSGIHIAADRVTIRDCRIAESLFGIYIRDATGVVVERCSIRGIPGRDPGEKGSGIHAYNTSGTRFEGNEIEDVRDGLYLQNSSNGEIRGNLVRHVRYGLHYMFSDDNVFEDNTFEHGDAGTAVMYSERIAFRRNRFVHNRGFASVGLLLQQCDDVLAEDNLIADNARGIFVEGTNRTTFRRNLVAESDVAIVQFASATKTRFEGNSFIGNLSPLSLVGKRVDTVFDGNYWSGNPEPDLDGDGRTDRPYRLSSVFDHFRGNLTAADLFVDGFAAASLGVAEQAFPVLQPTEAEDRAPLARPPDLAAVPRPRREARQVVVRPMVLSAAAFAIGATVLVRGRQTRRPRGGGSA